jgi:hypothetical protein
MLTIKLNNVIVFEEEEEVKESCPDNNCEKNGDA